MSLLDESLVISTELGMHPSMERGRSRLEQPPSSAGTAWLCEQSDLLRIGKTNALFKLRAAAGSARDVGSMPGTPRQKEDAGGPRIPAVWFYEHQCQHMITDCFHSVFYPMYSALSPGTGEP